MLNTDNDFDAFLQKPRGDKTFRLQISRNTLIAIIVSLLIHAIVLFLFVPKFNQDQAAELPARELEVSLAPPTPEKKVAELPVEQPATPVEKIPEPAKPKPKVITQQTQSPPKKPAFKVPDVLSTTKPAPDKVPDLSIPKENSPSTKPEEAPVDMMAYVNQQRARRTAQESDAARQNAEATARELGPSAEQKRDENIKRNFQTGVNGIFEITDMNLLARTANFTFNGWTNDFSNSRKEFFEVEAKSGQDVRLVMIRKMIGLIRLHYQGDFNWESHRLNRTIILSAKPEDSAGLEDFMMIEFFGQNYKTQ